MADPEAMIVHKAVHRTIKLVSIMFCVEFLPLQRMVIVNRFQIKSPSEIRPAVCIGSLAKLTSRSSLRKFFDAIEVGQEREENASWPRILSLVSL